MKKHSEGDEVTKPTPESGESREHYLGRCIPMVLNEGTASNQDQAVAMCYSMWRRHKKNLWQRIIDHMKKLGRGVINE